MRELRNLGYTARWTGSRRTAIINILKSGVKLQKRHLPLPYDVFQEVIRFGKSYVSKVSCLPLL